MDKNKIVTTEPSSSTNILGALHTQSQPGVRGRVATLDRRLARTMLNIFGDPSLRLGLWNGEEIGASSEQPIARVLIRDRGALYKLLSNPYLHFGDLYSVGRIEIEGDLLGFLETAYSAAKDPSRTASFKKLQSQLLKRARSNTLSDSRKNIHHHYDIGNDFYELWLDKDMQYTCAYFPSPDLSLEQAQQAKMDYVCRKLRLQPGERVIEAGCGWGGLALFMARNYGVKVRSYNISHEQIAYARKRATDAGLNDQIEYIEDDYRNITGTYDAFVSVGMLEHVGLENYKILGEIIDRSLTESGRGLIHSIGRNKPGLMNIWIEKRIFPGAYPPTLKEIMDILEPREFSVLDVENLRLHYAKTLKHWLDRFDAHTEKIQQMFDQYFVRAWRLYLVGSIAAFTMSKLQLFQVVFTRPNNNNLPWSRGYLYQDTWR